MIPAVSLKQLTKRYRTLTALDGLDLEIAQGEIFALLGPNGAGKTTAISIVAGLLRASSGTAEVLGRDVVREYRFTRRNVGLVPQEINYDPFFNVEEAIRFQAGYFGVKLTAARLDEVLEALGLQDKRKANTRALSGGMKRRLLIAKALVHEPRVLFLDEPTAGVDVELRQSLWRYVRTLRERGTTIVLTTHYLEEAQELADRVGVIHHGKLLTVDALEPLLQRHATQTLSVILATPVSEVPAPLRALGATSSEGGRRLEVATRYGQSFGPALAAVAEAGLQVVDVETRRMDLEDVFVSLVHPGAAP
ncbi:MAG: ABC transporter ATP-binding protein [Deltaproteobacteria bacterium]|nr:ABC transporter ATP-binding protein [Deltaproteobacteria bacterium]